MTLTRNNVRKCSMKQKKYKTTQQYGGIKAQERREKRRETFVEAGLEAFGTIGYGRSTIQDICKIAGLTQRYLYESFKDKEDLLVAVYQKLINDIETESRMVFEQSQSSSEDKMRELLKRFYQRFKDDPRRARVQLFEVLGVSSRVDKEYQSAMIKLADWIEKIMLSIFPEFKEKCEENNIVFMGGAGAIIQIAHHWTLEGLKIPVDQIVDETMKIFFTLGKYYPES